jgi:hypothetical protein
MLVVEGPVAVFTVRVAIVTCELDGPAWKLRHANSGSCNAYSNVIEIVSI